MQTARTIQAIEALIAITGNPDLPLSQALASLKALQGHAATQVAPPEPVQNIARLPEFAAADHVAPSPALAAALEPIELVQPAKDPEAAPKRRRGRPRKNA